MNTQKKNMIGSMRNIKILEKGLEGQRRKVAIRTSNFEGG